MDAAQKVLHTVMDLQRADGAFGYTYSTQERKVLDWSGFAGCWFAPALVYLYRLTGEERCLHSAEKALDYYPYLCQGPELLRYPHGHLESRG